MFKSQLPISLVVVTLLSLSPGDVSARFLQPSSNTSANATTAVGPMVISANPQYRNVTYRSDLQCGECVVGNYTFCINGPENFTGPVVPKTLCCQNLTSCNQTRNSSWTCSNKYNSNNLVDKLRVCPFNSQQCGSQQIIIDDVKDSQCLRLSTLKQGTACLYSVKSKCNAPNIQLNDTSLVYQSLMVSNTSLPTPSSGSCSAIRNQQCLCTLQKDMTTANSTNTSSSRLSCDCDTVRNYTLDNSACKCQVLKDVLGNEVRQCTCGIPSPIQYLADQECDCTDANVAAGQNKRYNCNCTSRSVSLLQSQCKCVSSLNAATKKTYQSCGCTDVPQCQDPDSFPTPAPLPTPSAAPCKFSYPCSCAVNSTDANGALVCNCTNPSTNSAPAPITVNKTQCQCFQTLNMFKLTFSQECKCCLPEDFVRARLIPPATCQGDLTAKQECSCLNSTANAPLSCICTNPMNNVNSSRLMFPNDNSQCDCDNLTLGTKQCHCCVQYETFAQQMQPVCSSNATIQACKCTGTAAKPTCKCVNSQNNLEFTNIVPVSSQSCYCDPTTKAERECNCCISESQYQASRPTCPTGREQTSCRCDIVKNGYDCNCTNRFFYNQTTSSVGFKNNQCACYNMTNTTSQNCTCCATQDDVIPSVQCAKDESFVSCSQCKYNSTLKTVSCPCTGLHYLDRSSAASHSSMTVSQNQCSCRNTTNCDCCVSNSAWQFAQLRCNNATQNSENCNCKNVTYVTLENRTFWSMKNVTTNVTCRKTGCSGELCASEDMVSSCAWNAKFACYANATCTYNASSDMCDFVPSSALSTCLAKPPTTAKASDYQGKPRASTVTSVTKLMNVSYEMPVNITRSRLQCACTNTKFPKLPLNNITISAQTCGGCMFGSANNCSCCVSKAFEDEIFYSNLTTCQNNTAQADCQCTGKFCNCTQRERGVSGIPLTFKNISVDTAKQCQCQSVSSTVQSCRCCIPSQAVLTPTNGPSCPVSSNSMNQSCECQDYFVASTGKMNLKCRCLVPPAPVVVVNTTNSTQNTTRTNTTSNVTNSSTNSNVTTNATSSNATTNGTRTNTTTNTSSSSNVTTNGTRTNTTVNSTSNVTSNATTNTTVKQDATTPSSKPEYIDVILTPQQCNCLTVNNGFVDVKQCKCCVQKDLTCAAATTAAIQDCACNRTATAAFWSCACTRKENQISRVFNMNKTLCQCNDATNECNCCMNKTSVESQWPVLQCNAVDQRQRCMCTTPSFLGDRRCNCTRNDNGILAAYSMSSSKCVCNEYNATNCTCCVTPAQTDVQVPQMRCQAVGQNLTSQYCSCKPYTVKVNATFSQNLTNCTCQKPEFMIPRTFTLPQSQCLCLNLTTGPRCECCLNSTHIDAQIPKLQCAPRDTSLLGCSCTYRNTSGSIKWDCDCKTTYQGSDYPVNNLDSENNNCMCNTTTCGCCVTDRIIEAATEKQCKLLQTNTKCEQCVSYNNRTRTNCSSCVVESSDYNVNGQSFTNLQMNQCLCRNETQGTNCSCCLTSSPVTTPSQVVCRTPVSEALPKCDCKPIANSTNLACDCSRSVSLIESYFYNVTIPSSNCSCLNVTRPNGVQSQQCSCCATPVHVSAAQPVCSVNTSSSEKCSCLVGSNPNTWNCDCSYKNTPTLVRNAAFTGKQCECIANNAQLKTCNCCVDVQQYRDALTPSCQPSDPLATCSCKNVKVGTANQLACNCSASLKSSPMTSAVNSNITLSPTQCGCYNETANSTSQTCKCCVREQALVAPVVKACRAADQFASSNCTCTPNQNRTAKDCSCNMRQGTTGYFMDSVRMNETDCSCVDLNTFGQVSQACSCCPMRTLLNAPAPVCDNVENFANQCNCTSSGCVCARGTGASRVVQSDLRVNVAKCSCMNTTIGNTNVNNCTCCVPPPPVPFCTQLARPNSTNLNCSCNDVVVNGKITFTCSCQSKVNATHTLTKERMLLDENKCCCTQKIDPKTNKGYKSCNCTQPEIFAQQNCQCRPVGTLAQTNQVVCNCTDCNNVVQTKTMPLNKCRCPSNMVNQQVNPASSNTTVKQVNGTNSTSNSTTNTTRPANATTNSTSNSTSNATKPANTTTSTNSTSNSTSNTTRPANTTTNTTSTNSTSNSTSNATKPANATTNTTSANSTNSTSNTTRPANTTTNTTANSTAGNTTKPATNNSAPSQPDSYACKCDVEFASFCSIPSKLDEGTCDLLNMPKATAIASDCKYQYEYLLAVVATGKDASALLQLQQYQMQLGKSWGQYLKASLVSLFLMASAFMML